MSLHFIFGRAGTGKTTRCCREIQDYLKKNPGNRAYLLVPDQGTYTAEYLLAKSFPGGGFIDVTVCGFSRLAYRVFSRAALAGRRCSLAAGSADHSAPPSGRTQR